MNTWMNVSFLHTRNLMWGKCIQREGASPLISQSINRKQIFFLQALETPECLHRWDLEEAFWLEGGVSEQVLNSRPSKHMIFAFTVFIWNGFGSADRDNEEDKVLFKLLFCTMIISFWRGAPRVTQNWHANILNSTPLTSPMWVSSK